MKVILLPPLDEGDQQTPVTESPALGYLAAYLEQRGHDAECFEPRLEHLKPDEIADRLGRSDAELIGFSVLDNVVDVYRIAARLRRRGCRAHVTLGGHLATFAHERILRDCREIDSVVRYEGELPLAGLADALERNEATSAVPGLTHRDRGMIRHNPPVRAFDDLDELPFPVRYLPDWHYHVKPINLIASKGCYFRCTFCAVHRFYREAPGKVKRYHSARYVVDQIEQLVQRYDNNRFWFMDEDMLGTSPREREWATDFIREIEARGLDIAFSLMCRTDTMNSDPTLFKRLYDVGLKRAFVGIENATPEVLARINKGTRKGGLSYIDSARAAGVELIGGMILFDRTTTEDELRRNLAFIAAHGSEIQFNYDVLKVFYGTTLYEELEREGHLRGEWHSASYEFERYSIATVFTVFKGFKSFLWKQIDLPLRGAVWRFIGLDEPPFPVECIRTVMGIYNSLAVEILSLALDLAVERGDEADAEEIFAEVARRTKGAMEEAVFAARLLQHPSVWEGRSDREGRAPHPRERILQHDRLASFR